MRSSLDNAGSGLVLILVILSIASITMMGAVNLGSTQQKTRTQNTLPYHVQVWRGNILSILTNSANFTATSLDATHNPGMACASVITSNCTVTNQQINYIDTNVGPAFPVGGANGITPSGELCNSFPSETCPVRFNVFWTCTNNCSGFSLPLPVPAPVRTFSLHVQVEYNPYVGTGVTSKTLVAFNANQYELNGIQVAPPVPAAPATFYFKP